MADTTMTLRCAACQNKSQSSSPSHCYGMTDASGLHTPQASLGNSRASSGQRVRTPSSSTTIATATNTPSLTHSPNRVCKSHHQHQPCQAHQSKEVLPHCLLPLWRLLRIVLLLW